MRFDKEFKETTNISYSISNTMGVISPLITFDSLFDISVGIISLIKLEYADPEVFNIDLLNTLNSKKDISRFSANREFSNPVLAIMNNTEDIDTAKDLYNQFISKRYNDILTLSVYTGIYDMISNIYADDIRYTVVYSKPEEKKLLEELGINSIPLQDLNKRLRIFKQFFFSTPNENIYLNEIVDNIKSKTIYFLAYKYNFKDDVFVENDNTITLRANRNIISCITPYNNEIMKENNNSNGDQ
jgi:hypothetical protein